MKRLVILLFALVSLSSYATTYYIATNGLDTNPGTEGLPFKTIAKAVSIANAGDVIYVRGGTYTHVASIGISQSGTAALPCSLVAYPGERPLLDFSGLASGKRGISVSGSYWVIKGLDVRKATDNGMFISGAYNRVEFCSFSDNQDSGLQLSGGANHNQIINCDSYWNADPTDYGDADGFAVKLDVGTGNYFYGCRAWLNVDDGWDGYMRGADDVTTTLENCWTWKNGWLKDGTDPGTQANGNGFKVGGSDDKLLKHNFLLRNCLAFDNKSKGFDQNNNRGDMYFYNCTGYRNGGNNFSIPSAIATGKVAEVKNCVAIDGKINLASFVVQSNNGWMSPFVTSAADFASLSTTGIDGPRQSDGSLPVLPFARLVAGSDLIDGGLLLSGIPYFGTAPDLGAFEFEPATEVSDVNGLSGYSIDQAYVLDGLLMVTLMVPSDFSGSLSVYSLSGHIVANYPISATAGLNYFRLSLNTSLRGINIVSVDGLKIQSKIVLAMGR
jgi:hypothetical protein